MRQAQSPEQDAEPTTEHGRARFTETHWSKLFEARIAASNERCSILDFLIRRYWKPVYCFLRSSGCGEEEAKDLVQDFFAACLHNGFFDKADPKMGRFRNLLLTSLKHFVANARRAAMAKKRHPSEGFAYIDDSAFQEEHPSALKHTETPDQLFHRAWLKDLVLRVLKELERTCRESGKQAHYDMFHRYLVAPLLEGVDAPHLRDLGASAGLSGKDAANRVLTVQRAFQRLLKEEIRLYASGGEEVVEELRELKRLLDR